MATSITFHLRPSTKEGRHAGRLFIRIIHARQCRHISRNYPVFEDEWDEARKKIIMPAAEVYGAPGGNNRDSDHPAGCVSVHNRRHLLTLIEDSMREDISLLKQIVSELEDYGQYTASDVVERFAESFSRSTLGGYATITSVRLREEGRDRTARAYRSAARSLIDFNGGKDLLLSQIDESMIAEYEKYLIDKELKLNTVSFYLRNLRALYFRAVGDKIIPKLRANPFIGMHTGVYETRRRALDDQQLKTLAKLEELFTGDCVDKYTGLRDCLMYFMFCYHARGMSFVDLAYLKKQDSDAETLVYRRRKTGGLLEIKITEPMRNILSHFARRTEGSEYSFPIIDSRNTHIHRQYETGLKRQNRMLKILGQMAGVTETLSTHAARHTWATLAKRLHVPVAVIGEALGHKDLKTTTIYLASFDRETMDELSVRLSDAAKAA